MKTSKQTFKRLFHKDSHKLRDFVCAERSGDTDVIMSIVRDRLKEKKTEFESRPHVDDDDFTKDFRYLMGVISAFELVLGIKNDAVNFLKEFDEGLTVFNVMDDC